MRRHGDRRVWALAAFALCTLTAGALWQLTAPNGDLFQYRCFALAFWQGSHATTSLAACRGRLPVGDFPAFRILPREYPPLAILPFSAPLLFGGWASMTLYVLNFNLLMALCLCLTAWLIVRIQRIQRSLAPAQDGNGLPAVGWYLLWLALGAPTIALVRFDALPALLTVAALALALRAEQIEHTQKISAQTLRRSSLAWYGAYALLALGTLLKLYPALFIPLLIIWQWRQRRDDGMTPTQTPPWYARWRRLGAPLLAGLIVVSLQALADALAGAGGAPWLGVQSHRPPQIESTAASLLWLWEVARGNGNTIHAVSVQRSLAFIEPPGQGLALVMLALLALALGWVAWGLATGALSLLRGLASALLALLGGASIFSPQYIIWALPFVVLALATSGVIHARQRQEAARRAVAIGLWTGACLFTTITYSAGYLLAWPAYSGGPLALFMGCVLARNLCVWGCAGVLMWPTRGLRRFWKRGSLQQRS